MQVLRLPAAAELREPSVVDKGDLPGDNEQGADHRERIRRLTRRGLRGTGTTPSRVVA
jgi:hypothetical protein